MTISLSVWLACACLVLSFRELVASQRLSERPVGDAPDSGARPEVTWSGSNREAAGDQWPYFGAALAVGALLLVACVVLTWCWDWKGAQQERGVVKEAALLPPPSRPPVNFHASLSQSDCAVAVASPRYPVPQAAGGASGLSSYGATPLGSSRMSLTPRWLCPQLTVPIGTELHCVLPNLVSGAKQNLVVHVCSIAERGSKPLFQARVVEADGDLHRAAISLEMMRASGAKYGAIKKNDTGGYIIASETGTLAVFSGSAMKHEMRVSDSYGATLAEVTPVRTNNAYDVVVYPNVDAGLITLALLAIEKNERVESSIQHGHGVR
mmetsp:Transcript_39520/g.103019  ORF Transcript_39520/g.103019 Transcript_39520/m.103019 type:complete len:323 (-) Transcript_39520:101-1069(-)